MPPRPRDPEVRSPGRLVPDAGAEPAPGFGAASQGPPGEPLAVFRGDAFNRLLGRLGLGTATGWRLWARVPALVILTYGPLLALAAPEHHLVGASYRLSLLADLACYAQFLGFIPLALLSEPFIDGKMREAWHRLHALVDAAALDRLGRRTTRLARSAWPDLVLVVLAYAMTWSWALDEVTNGLPSWHTAVDGDRESFTWAGSWAAGFALPVFTYLWMRWAWKIAVWTLFLFRLSRTDHRLVPTHPDRTGGLGCLSEVQTSFALILFGTGLLFSAAIGYKVFLEGTPLASYTVWFPVVGYVVLAPAVFLGPLFLFTRALARTRREALRRLDVVAVGLSRQFERRWLRAASDPREDLGTSSPRSRAPDEGPAGASPVRGFPGARAAPTAGPRARLSRGGPPGPAPSRRDQPGRRQPGAAQRSRNRPPLRFRLAPVT